MKVAIFAPYGFFNVYGGGEVYIRGIVDELINIHERGEIELFVLSADKKKEIVKYKGIDVVSVRGKEDVKDVLTTRKPDVVHANGLYELVVPICRELNIKSVVSIHSCMYICPMYTYIPNVRKRRNELCSRTMSIENCLHCSLNMIKGGNLAYPLLKHIPEEKYVRLGQWLESKRFIYFITPIGEAALHLDEKRRYWEDNICSADRVIVLSHRMAKMSLQNGMDKDKLSILHNGVKAPDYEVHFPSTKDGIKFFYHGRFFPSKGIHILLQAFHEVSNNAIELHLIGNTRNDYALKLKKKYKDDSRIIWHDEIKNDDIYEHIRNYHAFVHPSIGDECFSLSVAESLAAGKIAIATRCGGPEEQIEDGVNGFLVPTNNAQALKNTIENYSTNPFPPKEIRFMLVEEHVKKLLSIFET